MKMFTGRYPANNATAGIPQVTTIKQRMKAW